MGRKVPGERAYRRKTARSMGKDRRKAALASCAGEGLWMSMPSIRGYLVVILVVVVVAL